MPEDKNALKRIIEELEEEKKGLLKKATDLRKKRKELEGAGATYATSNDLIPLDQERTRNNRRLSEIEGELAQARIKLG